jgi:SAM-dependent methyltransferase
MGMQEAKFVKSEGDAWFFRNKDKPYVDHLGHAVRNCGLDLAHVDILEIGCGRGDGIGHVQPKTDGVCIGIDPSHQAILYAHNRYPGVDFRHGSARSLPAGHDFDIIIYSFCLYLCDREDLIQIVSEGDDALRDKDSRLIIQDFDPEYPHKVPYHHVPGLFSYKMDYSKLWLADPAYSLVNKVQLGDGTAIWTLKKDIEAGWPLEQLK